MSTAPARFADEQAVAIAAVREAAALCRAVQADIDGEALEKKDRSPVTVADFGSQALVCRALQAAFPGDPVIAEEDAATLRQDAATLAKVVARVQAHAPDADADTVCGWIDRGNAAQYADRFWTLDPIDGTKGFLRGDQYAIALALVVDGTVEVAALACPNLPDDLDAPHTTGHVFSAVRGDGTVQLPLDAPGGEATAVRVSALTDLAGGRFTDSFVSAHSSHDWAQAVADHLGMTGTSIRLDSQAKYALVARGDAEVYFRLPRGGDYTERIWDHAAGMLVVEAAGGTVTDIHGQPLDFTHGDLLAENEGIVATNGEAHDAVLAALKAVQDDG